MQQGMLFHTLYEGDSGAYFEQLVLGLKGKLEVSALQRAWAQVTQRHSALRSSFHWEEMEEPLQVVSKQVELPWVTHDWRAFSVTEQQAKLEALLRADQEQGFALDTAPLMRFTLIQLAETAWQLLWSHHHLLFDGWSMSIILDEVMLAYETYQQGKMLHMQPVRPYRDFILWLQEQDKAVGKAFWREKLQGFTAPTALYVDIPVNKATFGQAEEVQVKLSVTATEQLQSLAKQQRLTLNTVVQGAWALLLSHYSGEDDVVFGATVAGRPTAINGVTAMVGLFINTLPLRVRITSELPLTGWLQSLQQQFMELEQHQHVSLADIQRASDIPAGSTLFDTLVIFESYPFNEANDAEKTLEMTGFLSRERTNYPLALIGIPGKQLTLKFSYNNARFSAETVGRLLGHLTTLLEGMASDPARKLQDFGLLTPAECQQMLVEWNETEQVYQPVVFHHLFEQRVAQAPEAIALVYGQQQLSYAELNHRANQLAHYLQSKGVEPDSLVGVCIDRSIDMVVGILGIMKAGGAYIPLDPKYPAERLAYMLENSNASLLLTHQKLLAALPPHQAETVCLDTDWASLIAPCGTTNPDSLVQADNLAYVIYTSGSTGKPKGVMVEHKSIVNLLFDQQRQLEVTADSRVLQFASFSFDVAAWEITMTLGLGAMLVLADSTVTPLGDELWRVLHDKQVTHVALPPAALATLPMKALPQLGCLVVGGEKCPPDLARSWSAGRRFINAYGPSEATVCATLAEFNGNPEILTIGRPIANTRIYVLDRYQQPTPIGVPGELHIGGIGLARGYLHRTDLTAEKFISNPFSDDPDSRLYKTGDLVRYLPDGKLEFLGRIDHQVKLRGFRIELGEIEAIISQHPAVKTAVVMLREDIPGHRLLAAYVVTDVKEPAAVDTLVNTLQRQAKDKLPEYMLPAVWMLLETLPLSPNGKIDHKKLPVPDGQLHSTSVFEVPRNESEQTLLAIWQEVLSVQSISIHDNFFEIGGHSLLAMQVVSRVQEAFALDIPLAQLFDAPTIAQFAECLLIQQLGEADDLLLAELLAAAEAETFAAHPV